MTGGIVPAWPAGWAGLRRDPLVRVGTAVLAVEILPYLLPLLSDEGLATYNHVVVDAPLLALIILSFELRARGADRIERRFWRLLSFGFALWLVQAPLSLASHLAGGWTDPRYSLAVDVLYVGLYLGLLIALESAPHRERAAAAHGTAGLLAPAGAIVFAFGLLVYFVVIPQALARSSYETMVPSLTLYVVLDAFLVSRLARLRGTAAAGRWRSTYAWLLLMAALWLCTDTLELLMRAGAVPWVPEGTSLDVLWLLYYLPALFAGRVGGPAPRLPAAAARGDVLEGLWGGPPVVFAMAFPLVHFAFSTLAPGDPTLKPAREVCALVVLLALSTMALLHQRSLEAENARLERERAAALDHVQHQAYHDSLTGLANRRLLQDRLQLALARQRRHGGKVAVLFCDLDRFKAINDSLGHAFGDRLLKAVAERMAGCVREEDTLARVGGDEFTLLLPEIARAEDAVTVARKVQRVLAAPFLVEGHEASVTASVGVSLFPDDATDADQLLKNADVAMYRAKEEGRDGYELFSRTLADADRT